MVIDYKLNLSIGGIPAFVNDLLKRLEPLGVDRKNIFDIRLSLEEALINAVKHGNRLDKNKGVFLKIDVSPQLLEIEIKDEGRGFDHKNIPSPTDEKNIDKSSGRGIFLIKKFMDKVEFLDGGTKIKMVKYWKKRGEK